MTKASDRQIDGTHYKDLGDFQPWDVLKRWLTPEEYRGYQKGVAIAYLARERSKGGDKDIAKAAHHLEKLLEVFAEKPAPAVPTTPDVGGWIQWGGGNYPVAPKTLVQVKLRGGICSKEFDHAEDYHWGHVGLYSDIIAYRVEPSNG